MSQMSPTVQAIFYTAGFAAFGGAVVTAKGRVNLVAVGLLLWVFVLAWNEWAAS